MQGGHYIRSALYYNTTPPPSLPMTTTTTPRESETEQTNVVFLSLPNMPGKYVIMSLIVSEILTKMEKIVSKFSKTPLLYNFEENVLNVRTVPYHMSFMCFHDNRHSVETLSFVYKKQFDAIINKT